VLVGFAGTGDFAPGFLVVVFLGSANFSAAFFTAAVAFDLVFGSSAFVGFRVRRGLEATGLCSRPVAAGFSVSETSATQVVLVGFARTADWARGFLAVIFSGAGAIFVAAFFTFAGGFADETGFAFLVESTSLMVTAFFAGDFAAWRTGSGFSVIIFDLAFADFGFGVVLVVFVGVLAALRPFFGVLKSLGRRLGAPVFRALSADRPFFCFIPIA
jgi:hypothetical protein